MPENASTAPAPRRSWFPANNLLRFVLLHRGRLSDAHLLVRGTAAATRSGSVFIAGEEKARPRPAHGAEAQGVAVPAGGARNERLHQNAKERGGTASHQQGGAIPQGAE